MKSGHEYLFFFHEDQDYLEHSIVYSTFYFTHFFYVNFRGINLFRFEINILFQLRQINTSFLTNLRLFLPLRLYLGHVRIIFRPFIDSTGLNVSSIRRL